MKNQIELKRRWLEESGVTHFSVTSDGTTGPEWIRRLEDKGLRVSDYAKILLKSTDFKSTSGVTIEVVVLKGELFSDDDRITENIREEAKKRNLSTPNAEVACLIREKLTDDEIKDMGLWWIVTMHEPIKESISVPNLLSARRYDDGRWLDTSYDEPGHRWSCVSGFAFVASQVSTNNLDT